MFYFIVTIESEKTKEQNEYEEYIRLVKPIVEKYGGKYLVRSNKITALQKNWNPRRVIIIEWKTREQITECFSSEEYKRIVAKRENSVNSNAIIVESDS